MGNNKYEIFMSYSNMNIEQVNIINELDPSKIIATFDVVSGISNYVYVSIDIVEQWSGYLNTHFNLSRTHQRIGWEELSQFIGAIEEASECEIGELVSIHGYGNAVFSVKEVKEKTITAIISIRDREMAVEEQKCLVKKHENPEQFIYKEYLNTEYNASMLIDCKYIESKGLISDYDNILKFLIRVKIQYNKHKIILYKPNQKLRHIAVLFGLNIVKNYVQADNLVGDKFHLLGVYENIIIYNGKFFIDNKYIDEKQVITNRVMYLKESGIIKENITENRLYQIIQNNEHKKRLNKYWDIIINIGSDINMEETRILELKRKDLKKFVKKHKLTFYTENFDYYTKLIKY